jgi:hypothetical protein
MWQPTSCPSFGKCISCSNLYQFEPFFVALDAPSKVLQNIFEMQKQ